MMMPLAKIVDARRAYNTRCMSLGTPSGVSSIEWSAWIMWVRARLALYDEAIHTAKIRHGELRREQHELATKRTA